VPPAADGPSRTEWSGLSTASASGNANFEEFDAYGVQLHKSNKGQTLRLYSPETLSAFVGGGAIPTDGLIKWNFHSAQTRGIEANFALCLNHRLPGTALEITIGKQYRAGKSPLSHRESPKPSESEEIRNP
jgi:hypothetical protein